MEPFKIPRLPFDDPAQDPAGLSAHMDTLPKEEIGVINWPEFSYKPEVHFAVAWAPGMIVVKYYVREEVIRARFTEDNAPVWKDSCVEFFVAPGDDGVYYNFEINCIGTCLAEKGLSRSPREKLQPEVIEHIKRFPSLGVAPFEEKKGDFSWELLAIIPVASFVDHAVEPDLQGKTFRANFYKCGDELSKPHYLTWNPVRTPQPDYHRPEFFREILFV